VAKVGQRFAQLAAADDTFRQENFLSPTKKNARPRFGQAHRRSQRGEVEFDMELNREHWERVYASKAPSDLSWFQTVPEASLRLIAATGIRKDNAIIDVGGGTSRLVDTLLDAGFTNLTVLDVSRSALDRAKARLGRRAAQVDWLEEDVTEFDTSSLRRRTVASTCTTYGERSSRPGTLLSPPSRSTALSNAAD
jgi:2-polyprenyl-3-methyl-5-hydroxy-6-metoxy-1,4-benzoquinol methylase